MYVAVKGGEKAIQNAHDLLAEKRRGDRRHPPVSLAQIEQQLGLAVDRVMTEGSLYDRRLGALAVKQAQGDLVEAVFLLRAYRATLPRFGFSLPLDTDGMHLERRISAAYKDLPGGQMLGATYDYTHRLLDFALAAETDPDTVSRPCLVNPGPREAKTPRIGELLSRDNMVESEEPRPPLSNDAAANNPFDITREPLNLPADRSARLQNLFRADEGFVLGMGYSTQRGFGAATHPFLGEIRSGAVRVDIEPEELGFPITIGEIELTECVMLHRFAGSSSHPPRFIKGYGVTFGRCERKAMAMALVDRALRGRELDERVSHAAQNEEFVLYHSDNVEASGFVEHLKLPHYVDFQADLVLMRRMMETYDAAQKKKKDLETDDDRTTDPA